jgi:nitrate/nitrite transporter NarK
MIDTPASSTDIVLRFAWDDAFERVYASWHREVRVAERAHGRLADRLGRRNSILSVLVVLTTALAAVAAFAATRPADVLERFRVDATLLALAAGTMAATGTLLAVVQAQGRFAARAEVHRLASIRYDSLDREMAATIAMPRGRRVEPDRALNAVRARMDRYAERSPTVPRHLRRVAEAELAAGAAGAEAGAGRAPLAVGRAVGVAG